MSTKMKPGSFVRRYYSINPLLTLGSLFSLTWIGFLGVYSVVDFAELILFLEKYVSHDGLISQPYKAVAKVALTPLAIFVLILSVSIFGEKLRFPRQLFLIYFLYFSAHLVFHTSYKLMGFGDENVDDNLLEWITFGCSIVASILFFICGTLKIRFAFFLSAAWLFFALEEISWGQRIFDFASPGVFLQINHQQETNIHNFFNPYLLSLYVMFNFTVFLFLTWFRRVRALSKIYRSVGVAYVLSVSDRFGLWLIPLLLTFASTFPGHEFVEEQWGFLGLILSILLLIRPILLEP